MISDYYEIGILKNPVQRYWHKRRFKEITTLVGRRSGLLLDVGCNGGLFTEKIRASSGANVIGVDISKNFVKHTVDVYSIPALVADGRYLPFKDEVFDCITGIEVLEHVGNPEIIVKQMQRCLRRGGSLIILVPNEKLLFKIFWFVWVRTYGKVWRFKHIVKFNLRKLRELLGNPEFEIVKEITFISGLLMAIEAIRI